MRRLIKILTLFVATSMFLPAMAACNPASNATDDTTVGATDTDHMTESDDPDENLPTLEQWVASEMEFTSLTAYEDPCTMPSWT